VLLAAAAPAPAQAPPSAGAPRPSAPAAAAAAELDRNLKAALDSIWATRIKAHVKFLSHDLLEGRGTGERGGDLAAEYVASQFAHAGLAPAIPADANTFSYFQPVPLIGTETDPNNSTLSFTKDAQTVTPAYLDQAVYWSETQQPLSEASSELVFVGYGALAPEFGGWNDFKDVDLTGKILLMLVNDPPSEDPNHFGGKALTYYGRWTYKYWVAAEKGAAGAILVHNTDMAGYGWDVVRNSWGKERASLPLDPEGTPPLRLAGWITEETAKQVVAMAGQDLGALVRQAATREFRPVPLGVSVTGRVTSRSRNFVSQNVVGFFPGADPARNREFVIYTAHYDHLGIGQPVGDDRIYNGAEDNATGVAALIEIARSFTVRQVKPRRTLIFIAVTAEEQGLKGSEYFTNRRNLFILPGRMAADINLDGLSPIGETRDYVFLGADRSPQLRQYVEDGARLLEYAVKPDPHPEKGHFYRSDHFNFARIGVPSVSIDNGLDYLDRPEGWGEEQYQEYLTKRYHQPDDEFDPAWDLKGLARTAKIAFYIGYRATMDDAMPVWNKGDEFEEERTEALAELPPDPAKP
jgi:Zn-dependent M28 family amino/carboxypeptidase